MQDTTSPNLFVLETKAYKYPHAQKEVSNEDLYVNSITLSMLQSMEELLF